MLPPARQRSSDAGRCTARQTGRETDAILAWSSRCSCPFTHVTLETWALPGAAVSALDWSIDVPNGIKAKVEKGGITLEGPVEWQFQKAAAERAVRYLSGVKGITNFIVVKPKQASSFDVSQRIKDALRRSAEFDASRITVQAADGKVTLTGKVRSWAERTEAEWAAWAAPGVSQVDDRIEVAS